MKIPFLKYSVVKLSEFKTLRLKLQSLEDEMENATSFIAGIEDGNLDVALKGSSDSKLANALISMQQKMKKINDEENERKWTTEGLAKFVDILRTNNVSVEELCNTIISNLIKYLNSNQGALFILNDNDGSDIYLEMIACYAYNRKKFFEKKFSVSEGLVGQCYLEKERILLTEVPADYVNITSGMGEATPGCILLVPLRLNDKVYGIIEIADFKIFKPFQIAFIEKLAETIASTISSVKMNEKTKKLLEESMENEEKYRQQEEEMRQNLEELHATQEQMQRQEHEVVESMQNVIENLKREMEEKEKIWQAQMDDLRGQLGQRAS